MKPRTRSASGSTKTSMRRPLLRRTFPCEVTAVQRGAGDYPSGKEGG